MGLRRPPAQPRATIWSASSTASTTGVWNPAADRHLAAPYGPDEPTGRAANRAAVQQRFGLDPDPDAPLFTVVSRLTGQKGIDLLAGGPADASSPLAASWRCSARGEPALEGGFRAAAAAIPAASAASSATTSRSRT